MRKEKIRNEKKTSQFNKRANKRKNNQKISKDINYLNHTVNQLNIINLYRILYWTTVHVLFSSAYKTSTKRVHIFGYKLFQ